MLREGLIAFVDHLTCLGIHHSLQIPVVRAIDDSIVLHPFRTIPAPIVTRDVLQNRLFAPPLPHVCPYVFADFSLELLFRYHSDQTTCGSTVRARLIPEFWFNVAFRKFFLTG
jgi:hypothetical protein